MTAEQVMHGLGKQSPQLSINDRDILLKASTILGFKAVGSGDFAL
jgi:hypothetical protein